jgi:predicted RNA-binding protein with PUA-like domain
MLKKESMQTKTNYWLLKTEPATFSIDDLMKAHVTNWDGVRNYEARNNLRKMQVDDGAFIYHSSTKQPGIVGLGIVCKSFFPDETAFDKKSEYYDQKSSRQNPIWFSVEVKFLEKYSRLISLDELKTISELKDFRLLRMGNRLSVIGLDLLQASAIMEYSKRGVN